MNSDVSARLRDAIRRSGPIPFERFMETSLYGDGGFFATGRGAGRSDRDFVTSPTTGSFFGLLVGRAIDREWEALGRPDPFVVIEVGAGDGRLCRDVLRSNPDCAPALRYVMVECSDALRRAQHATLTITDAAIALGPHALDEEEDAALAVPDTGPIVTQLSSLPAGSFAGVVIANELLDNLPLGVAEFDGQQWCEVRVGLSADRLCEVLVPLDPDHLDLVADVVNASVARGTRVPMDRSLTAWLAAATRCLRRGAVILIDYMIPMAELIERSPDWLRTYSDHQSGASCLATPGACDITADVPVEHLERAARRCGWGVATLQTQAAWLEALGIEAFVGEARTTWRERAHIGDLAAIAARSRVHEAEALCDPNGLGAFMVSRLQRDPLR